MLFFRRWCNEGRYYCDSILVISILHGIPGDVNRIFRLSKWLKSVKINRMVKIKMADQINCRSNSLIFWGVIIFDWHSMLLDSINAVDTIGNWSSISFDWQYRLLKEIFGNISVLQWDSCRSFQLLVKRKSYKTRNTEHTLFRNPVLVKASCIHVRSVRLINRIRREFDLVFWTNLQLEWTSGVLIGRQWI